MGGGGKLLEISFQKKIRAKVISKALEKNTEGKKKELNKQKQELNKKRERTKQKKVKTEVKTEGTKMPVEIRG